MTAPADAAFLELLEAWLCARSEILVLIRYSHAAGNKDFEFFSSFEALATRIGGLPPKTEIIAFREPQLSLRGIVDDAFVSACLDSLPDGAEILLVETKLRESSRWFNHAAGETHAELREALEDTRGWPVAVGLYPPWLSKDDGIATAIVPDPDGVARRGVY